MIKCIGGKVLSELPYSYRLEDKTLFLHLHLPLLDQAFHLYNLQDFPISGPLGKPVFSLPTPALRRCPRTRGHMYGLLDAEAGTGRRSSSK